MRHNGKWLQQLCPDSGYEAKLEEDPVNGDEDGGGGSIDDLIALTYPRASTACMKRIPSRPRR